MVYMHCPQLCDEYIVIKIFVVACNPIIVENRREFLKG